MTWKPDVGESHEFSPAEQHGTFTIAEGEMFFVPSGYLHAIVNTGGENAEFLVAFYLIMNRRTLACPGPLGA